MVRAILLLFVLALSGCLGAEDGRGREAPDDSGDATAPAASAAGDEMQGAEPSDPPKPVDIDETHDLTMGAVDLSWKFQILPGATASIDFYLQGGAETDAHVTSGHCFELRGGGKEVRSCPQAGVSTQVSLSPRHTFFSDDDPPAGNYSVSFDASPSLATLRAVVQVWYGA